MYSSCANIKNINETHYSAPLLLVSVSVTEDNSCAQDIGTAYSALLNLSMKETIRNPPAEQCVCLTNSI